MFTAICATAMPAKSAASLSGKVTDAVDNSALVGVTIFIPELSEGTTTDINGAYSLQNLPQKPSLSK